MKHDLLAGRLRPAFFTLFASALGGTLISTIYATVDIICVGQHSGPDATAAISCVNPLWSIMIGPGLLAGVGGSVLMANRRATGKEGSARGYLTAGMALAAVLSLIVTVVLVSFPRELIGFFGAEGQVLEYGVTYMRPVALSAFTFTLASALSAYMRNSGEAFTPTVATAIGGVVNMVLDVYLVFGLDLGVFGAGMATAIGQSVAFVVMVAYLFSKKSVLKFTKVKRIRRKLASITTLGFSALVIEIAFAVTVTVYNKMIFGGLGGAHLAVYGTASTLAVMFYCLFNAVGTAMQPLVSAAHGAGKQERISEVLRLSVRLTLALGVLFLLLVELFPETILRLYMDVTDEVVAVGPRIMRIYSLGIVCTGISILSTFYFQSVLKRGASVLVTVLRGLALPLAFAAILPTFFGIDAIWWGIPLSELITLTVAAILLVRDRRRTDGGDNTQSDAQ